MCSKQIHDDLILLNESVCPFCDILLDPGNTKAEPCCHNQNIMNFNFQNFCGHCGMIESYDFITHNISFYDNLHKINKQSLYHRKYHIIYKLNWVCHTGVNLTYYQRQKIYVFAEIADIIPYVNKGRKRLISSVYIIKQILILMGVDFGNIKVSKSKKTRAFYANYWAKICLLKFDKIMKIIKN